MLMSGTALLQRRCSCMVASLVSFGHPVALRALSLSLSCLSCISCPSYSHLSLSPHSYIICLECRENSARWRGFDRNPTTTSTACFNTYFPLIVMCRRRIPSRCRTSSTTTSSLLTLTLPSTFSVRCTWRLLFLLWYLRLFSVSPVLMHLLSVYCPILCICCLFTVLCYFFLCLLSWFMPLSPIYGVLVYAFVPVSVYSILDLCLLSYLPCSVCMPLFPIYGILL